MPAPPAFGRTSPSVADEIFRLQVEALRREIDDCLARGSRGLPDLHAAALDAVRAGGSSLVGRERGIALDISDLVDTNAELLGRDLGNRDAQPLAEIDLAAVHGHGAIAVHGEKRIDLLGVETARRAGYALRRGRVGLPVSAKPTVSAPPLSTVRREKRFF